MPITENSQDITRDSRDIIAKIPASGYIKEMMGDSYWGALGAAEASSESLDAYWQERINRVWAAYDFEQKYGVPTRAGGYRAVVLEKEYVLKFPLSPDGEHCLHVEATWTKENPDHPFKLAPCEIVDTIRGVPILMMARLDELDVYSDDDYNHVPEWSSCYADGCQVGRSRHDGKIYAYDVPTDLIDGLG